MSQSEPVAYDFAVLRLIPHVHRYSSVCVGVVLHARTAGFLGAAVLTDPASLAARAPECDTRRVAQYLRVFEAIADGHPDGGRIALLPPSERFHWLTAPRSDVLQSSAIHVGLTTDPTGELGRLFDFYVDPDSIQEFGL